MCFYAPIQMKKEPARHAGERWWAPPAAARGAGRGLFAEFDHDRRAGLPRPPASGCEREVVTVESPIGRSADTRWRGRAGVVVKRRRRSSDWRALAAERGVAGEKAQAQLCRTGLAWTLNR